MIKSRRNEEKPLWFPSESNFMSLISCQPRRWEKYQVRNIRPPERSVPFLSHLVPTEPLGDAVWPGRIRSFRPRRPTAQKASSPENTRVNKQVRKRTTDRILKNTDTKSPNSSHARQTAEEPTRLSSSFYIFAETSGGNSSLSSNISWI